MTNAPDPLTLHPMPGFDGIVFLKPLLAAEPVANISVGDYSYYHDFDDATAFFRRNVRYNVGFSGTRLEIGKYCAIAHGATFIMAEANHPTGGATTFPFAIFGGAWADPPIDQYPYKPMGDMVIGNDVWIGYGATILPGTTIGHGAIIGAHAVVGGTVPDYAVVAGNPARVIRKRFDDATIARLVALAWWDWPVDKVTRAIPLLARGGVDDLERL